MSLQRFVLCILSLCVALQAQTPKRVTRDDAVMEKQNFEKYARIALVVGVGGYPQASNLSVLKYAAKDALQVAAVLKEQGYLVRTLVNAEAMRGSIRSSLTQLAQAVDQKEGLFLFYFSGHGFAVDGSNYLATYGTTADDLKAEGLAVAEVEKLLKGSGAKRVLMFLDACRNEPTVGSKAAPGSSFSEDRRARLESSEGLRVLYSTKAGMLSYESPELQQGVYTHFLLEGLAGGASGYSRDSRQPDGLISFSDLSQFMVDKMRVYAVERNAMQIPYEAGESTGDFLVATKAVDAGKLQAIRQNAGPPVPTNVPAAPVPSQPQSAAANSPTQGLGAIAKDGGSTKLAVLTQVWRDTLHNRLFRIKFEASHAYLYDHQSGKVLADLTLKQRKNKTDIYEGKTTLAKQCPGGQGDIEFTSWSATRIEMKVEAGNKDANTGRITCGKAFGIGFTRAMQPMTLVAE